MKKKKKVTCPLWLDAEVHLWMLQRAEKEGRTVSGLGAFLLKGIKEQEAREGE